MSEMARPSILGSVTSWNGSPSSSRRTRSTQAQYSSSLRAFASESIGWGCSTWANCVEGVAPTRWVGESGVTSSGCSSSSARSSRTQPSYSPSSTVGSSSTW